MKELIWPLTTILVSGIWALAWMAVAHIKYIGPLEEDEE